MGISTRVNNEPYDLWHPSCSKMIGLQNVQKIRHRACNSLGHSLLVSTQIKYALRLRRKSYNENKTFWIQVVHRFIIRSRRISSWK